MNNYFENLPNTINLGKEYVKLIEKNNLNYSLNGEIEVIKVNDGDDNNNYYIINSQNKILANWNKETSEFDYYDFNLMTDIEKQNWKQLNQDLILTLKEKNPEIKKFTKENLEYYNMYKTISTINSVNITDNDINYYKNEIDLENKMKNDYFNILKNDDKNIMESYVLNIKSIINKINNCKDLDEKEELLIDKQNLLNLSNEKLTNTIDLVKSNNKYYLIETNNYTNFENIYEYINDSEGNYKLKLNNNVILNKKEYIGTKEYNFNNYVSDYTENTKDKISELKNKLDLKRKEKKLEIKLKIIKLNEKINDLNKISQERNLIFVNKIKNMTLKVKENSLLLVEKVKLEMLEDEMDIYTEKEFKKYGLYDLYDKTNKDIFKIKISKKINKINKNITKD